MELKRMWHGLSGVGSRATGAMLAAVLFATNLAASGPAAMEREPVVKFFSPEGGEDQVFGRHIALHGDVAVITEPEWCELLPPLPGTAFVYRYDAEDDVWVLEAQLAPFGGHDGKRFGESAATDGEVIVIGCNCHDQFVSFVFRYDADSGAWMEEQVLEGSGSAAISGNVIVVGDHVYRYDQQSQTWQEEEGLDVEWLGARGGGTAAIDGDRIVLGYDYEDYCAGAARVFEYDEDTSEWRQTARLNASDAAEQDRFGTSVAVVGDFIAVGAPDPPITPDEPGTVYIFHLTGDAWEEVAMITPDDGSNGDNFGNDLALDGSTLVVGANDNDPHGSVYVYDFDAQTYEYTLIGKLRPFGPEPYDFGTSVAMSESRALVGDFRDSELAIYAGAAYIYELPTNDCPADVNLDDVVDIDDLFQVLSAWGPCEDCPEDLDDSGIVDIDDIFAVLSAWGPC